MLSLSGGKRSYPKLLPCKHWSFWLEEVDEDTWVCGACKKRLPQQVDTLEAVKSAKLLEYL